MKNTKYFLVLSIVTVLFCQLAVSQENVKIKKSEFIVKQEGYKSAWNAVKQGNKYFSEGKAQFRAARAFFLKANIYNNANPELNYKIGVCYLYADDKLQAIKYLKKAYDLKHEVAEDIHFQMARAFHMSQDFDNAIKEYKFFQTKTSERKLRKMKLNIPNYISECENGKKLITKPLRIVLQNPGKTINSEYDDYLSVIDSKEETMYFTSRRMSKKNNKRNFLDKKFSEEIYVSKKKNKDWTQSQLLSKSFSSNESEAALALSPDNTKLYIYKSKSNGDVFWTSMKNGAWSKPKSLRFNSRDRETSVCFTPDGKRVYFVSNREDGSLGGKDIYYCDINEKGKYSKPQNAGPTLNTSENEEAISLSKDGKTIYFSSKGHTTMGGYDVFTSTINANGKWSIPENIGYPINTPDDDLFFSMMPNGKSAYISSNREQGFGEKDIYKVVYLGEEKDLVISTENTPMAYNSYDVKTLLRTLPGAIAVDSSFILSGKILDSETKNPIMAKIQLFDSQKSTIAAVLVSDSLGNYKARLPEKKTYGIEITAKGYLFYLDVVNLSKETSDVMTKDFVLQALEVGAKVVMKNIFFETGKSTLKDESFQQLNNVIEFMKENSTLKLEISGHSDNVGSVSSNLKLSEARAKAVVEYMVIQGIERSRLTFKGYGPNQPIAPNTTPEGKAQNRRVEFKITGK
jgi:outer membrane protein OmpA-like peptidoglycan-associated protein/tetratricopeptide (TPR) repeat protein